MSHRGFADALSFGLKCSVSPLDEAVTSDGQAVFNDLSRDDRVPLLEARLIHVLDCRSSGDYLASTRDEDSVLCVRGDDPLCVVCAHCREPIVVGGVDGRFCFRNHSRCALC